MSHFIDKVCDFNRFHWFLAQIKKIEKEDSTFEEDYNREETGFELRDIVTAERNALCYLCSMKDNEVTEEYI